MELKELVRKVFGKLAGVNKLQEQVDTMFYFLNAYLDPRDCPKATGALRDLQECDTLLLKIFDRVCRKHGLVYWLEAGTLLGAVRHGGFIPWDDDVDISMPRDDFDRAKTVLCEELRSYGIQAKEDMLMRRIGIGYKHKATGVWIDVFPVDYCSMDLSDNSNRDALQSQINMYRKHISNSDEKKMLHYREKYVTGLCKKEHAASVFFGPEAIARLHGWKLDHVFPLREINFEGHMLYAPAHESYLQEFYGPNYMKFPKDGVLHHGDASGSLVDWARNSGTNMEDIKKELSSILEHLEN